MTGAATVSERTGECSATWHGPARLVAALGTPRSPLTEALLAAVGGSVLAALPQDGGPTAHCVAAVRFCEEVRGVGSARVMQADMAVPWGDDAQHPAMEILHQGPVQWIYTQQ